MADSYSQFSEVIDKIKKREDKWVNEILRMPTETDEEVMKVYDALGLEVDLEPDALDNWPNFEWSIYNDTKHKRLHLYAEDQFDENHLIWFVQAFLRRFRPTQIFTMTGAGTCSKPRAGEFGGWWLAISANGIEGGNTWDAVVEAAKKLEKAHEDPT
jgi:hypothetical protein